MSATAWLSALGAGVLYYAVAFWFYVTGLSGTAPGIAGMFINLIPVFGIASSDLILDERLTGRQWIGAGPILLAVVAITNQQSSAPHPRDAGHDHADQPSEHGKDRQTT